jgi:hypothetical protein
MNGISYSSPSTTHPLHSHTNSLSNKLVMGYSQSQASHKNILVSMANRRVVSYMNQQVSSATPHEHVRLFRYLNIAHIGSSPLTSDYHGKEQQRYNPPG